MTIPLWVTIMVALMAGSFAGIIAPLFTAHLSRKNWRLQKRLELKLDTFRGATAALASWWTDALDLELQNTKPEYKGRTNQVRMRPGTAQALAQSGGLVAAFFSADVWHKYDQATLAKLSVENVPNTEFEAARLAFIEAASAELGLTADV